MPAVRSLLIELLREPIQDCSFQNHHRAASGVHLGRDAARAYLRVQREVEALFRSVAGGLAPDLEGTTQLAEATAEIEAFLREFQSEIDRVSRPRKHIDEKKLDEIRAVHPPGSGEMIEDILARLEAGGDL